MKGARLGEQVWWEKAYAVVKTEEGVIADDVRESPEHAVGAIGGSGLEADLLMVS